MFQITFPIGVDIYSTYITQFDILTIILFEVDPYYDVDGDL